MRLCCAGAGAALLLFVGAGFADDVADRSKLTGTWKAADNQGKTPEVWILAGQQDESIRLSHSENARTVAEFECNTLGRECKVRVSGKSATVSMWFNGSNLVQMETRGSDVVKRQFSPAGGGDSLDVEVTPLVPAGKPQVTRFKRTEATAKATP